MLEGLYAAAAGMEAQQTQLDAISNDVANSDTPGYQATEVGFHDLLSRQRQRSAQPGDGRLRRGRDDDRLQPGAGSRSCRPATRSTSAIGGERLPRGQAAQRNDRTDPQRHAPGRLHRAADDDPRDAGPAADHDPEGHRTLRRSRSPPTAPSAPVRRSSARSRSSPCPRRPAAAEAGDGVFSATSASGRGQRERHDTSAGRARAVERRHQHRDVAMMADRAELRLASKAIEYESQMAQIASTLKTDELLSLTDPLVCLQRLQPGCRRSARPIIPASVRNGNAAAKQAYTEATRVRAGARQAAGPAADGDRHQGSSDSSSDGSSDGSSDSGLTPQRRSGDATTGMLGSDPARACSPV